MFLDSEYILFDETERVFGMLNEALKSIRVFHRLSQNDLANRLNVSKSYVSEIEGGKKNITMSMLKKYESCFDIPASSIVELGEKMENRKKLPKHKKLIVDIISWLSKEV
ncbi:helix-turn-helix domain-containing protein [Paraglaciecola marina]|uniref:helix-turn-helix domain-containing protein n=1 Tax=Paraglaciecola marina TaxID=2500157 RepID=UPI001EEFC8A0|nr:helix-turn-helix transcriptional regulator [Paraglaciecola marina]